MADGAQNMRAEWLRAYERITASLPQQPALSRVSHSQAIKLWEENVVDIIGEISALARERRNDFAQINTLPVELLSNIFEHHVETYRPYLRQDFGEHFKGWASSMLVCRRWRSIALETAALWATIALNSRQPAELYMQRAKKNPLCLFGDISAGGSHTQRLAQILQPANLRRLRELELSIHPSVENEIRKIILSLPSYDAPQLERLQLGLVHWTTTTPTSLSPAFFSTQAPQLRSVTLAGYFFPWGAPCRTLRCLSLAKMSHQKYPGAFEDVLASLSTMTVLETLTLKSCLPLISTNKSQYIESHNAVTLPCLMSLSLVDSNDECWVLWALLKTHPAARIRAEIPANSTVPLLVTALSRQIHCPHSPIYTSLEISSPNFRDRFSRISFSFFESSQTEVAGIQFNAQNIAVPAQSAIEISNVVSPENIQTLKVALDFEDTPFDDTVAFFASFTNLRSLHIQSTPATKAISHLLFSSGSIEDKADVPFPELEELHIADVNLTSPTSFASGGVQQLLWMQLRRALELRHKVGCGLSRLKVEMCELRTSWIQAWKAVVREVHYHRHRCFCKGTYHEETLDTDSEHSVQEDEDAVEDEDSGDDYIPAKRPARGRGGGRGRGRGRAR